MKKLTLDNVEISVRAEPETESPIGQFVSGDPDYLEKDKAFELKILADSEWNEWAWCCVKVTAYYGDFQASEYLGMCSYENEKDFRENSGMFEDMKLEALGRLNEKLEQVALQLKPLMGDN